jgi:hypothetical protein
MTLEQQWSARLRELGLDPKASCYYCGDAGARKMVDDFESGDIVFIVIDPRPEMPLTMTFVPKDWPWQEIMERLAVV